MVLAAAALRLAFFQALGTRAVYVTFYPAVMLAALYGGLRAGLLATLLAALVTELREAQRLTHIGNWHWDAKTDATTGSDELLRIFGLDPATQTMPDFREQRGRCDPVEDWERVNAAVRITLETGVGYEQDVRGIRDGTPIWVTTRSEAVRDAGGRIVGLRGTVQDITDRKHAGMDSHRWTI
jgi:PAS domain-containing protein